MFAYGGPADVTRLVQDELHEDELKSRIRTATNMAIKDISLDVAVLPFHNGNPPMNVSSLKSGFMLVPFCPFLPCSVSLPFWGTELLYPCLLYSVKI